MYLNVVTFTRKLCESNLACVIIYGITCNMQVLVNPLISTSLPASLQVIVKGRARCLATPTLLLRLSQAMTPSLSSLRPPHQEREREGREETAWSGSQTQVNNEQV